MQSEDKICENAKTLKIVTTTLLTVEANGQDRNMALSKIYTHTHQYDSIFIEWNFRI